MQKVRKQLPTKQKGVIVDMSNVGLGAETDPSYYIDNTMFPLEGVTVTGVDRSQQLDYSALNQKIQEIGNQYQGTAPIAIRGTGAGPLGALGVAVSAYPYIKEGLELAKPYVTDFTDRVGRAINLAPIAVTSYLHNAFGSPSLTESKGSLRRRAEAAEAKNAEQAAQIAALTASRDSAIAANASRNTPNDTIPRKPEGEKPQEEKPTEEKPQGENKPDNGKKPLPKRDNAVIRYFKGIVRAITGKDPKAVETAATATEEGAKIGSKLKTATKRGLGIGAAATAVNYGYPIVMNKLYPFETHYTPATNIINSVQEGIQPTPEEREAVRVLQETEEKNRINAAKEKVIKAKGDSTTPTDSLKKVTFKVID